jgi:hypothetical protein
MPPATESAALTASSNLQHLDISRCRLQAAALQQMFPADRQLSQLRSLIIKDREWLPGPHDAARFGSNRLVSCCPGLQSLNLVSPRLDIERLLASLPGLPELRALSFWLSDTPGKDIDLQGLTRLTGLQKLHLEVENTCLSPQGALLQQLTRLEQVTELTVHSRPYWLELIRQVSASVHMGSFPFLQLGVSFGADAPSRHIPFTG